MALSLLCWYQKLLCRPCRYLMSIDLIGCVIPYNTLATPVCNLMVVWELLELLLAGFSTQALGEPGGHMNTSWWERFCLKFKLIWYTVCFAELGDFFPPAAVAHLSTSICFILVPLWEFCHLLGYFSGHYLGLLLFWTLALSISGHMLLVISCSTPISLLVTRCLIEEKDL